jgi:hypothetical protein
MKPINLDNSPCSPISSNCVIWQGPDIPCIKLCRGDTISDVIHKLAIELCNIMDLLDVNGYDLSCFDLASCKPQNIQELIQFLIERICALEAVDAAAAATPTTTGSAARSTSADTLVTVAPCFVVGTTTVMTIVEYAQAMGTRICGIIDQITIINTQITNLDIRVATLEGTPVVFPPTPSIVINCNIGILISGNAYTIDSVLDQLINNVTNGYCAYTSVLGTPSNITSSFTPGCVFGAPITTDPNWTVVPTDLSETLTNIWIAICSIYSSITPLTTQDSSTINLDFTANVLTARINDTGWVDLNGFGYYTGAETLALKPQARRIGNVVHFRGLINIPIDDGTGVPALWQYSSGPSVDTYYLSTTVTPATVGPDSVNLATAGTVIFNQGLSVIPTTIMDAGELFDNTYGTNFLIGARPVQIDAAPVTSTILSGLFNLSITSTKTLVASLPKNAEQNAFSGTNAYNTSHLNYIVSHVTSGEFVPKFDNANTNVNSNAASGTIALDLEYDATLTYPFSCNANDEQEVGGFRIILDGLTAYIDPCTTDIKYFTCP